MLDNKKNSAKQVWLCDLAHDYQTMSMNKMPLGIGLIAAYCQKQNLSGVEYKIFKFLEELKNEVKKGEAPLVIGFTNYVWNTNLSIEVAKRVKDRFPAALIVFGGPNFTADDDERIKFFNKNPWIDLYVTLEGEKAFYNILKLMLELGGDIKKVKDAIPPNTVFLKDGALMEGKVLERIDLAEIPSPYLEGLFDKYFGKLMPMVQSVRGCPFQCAYCYDGLPYWCLLKRRNMELLKKEMEYIAKRCLKTDHFYITDANFGMYEEDLEVSRAIAELQDKYSWPWYISINTGKYNKDRIFEAVKLTRGTMAVSAALQSTDPVVLKNVKRINLPLKDIVELVNDTKKISSAAGTSSHLILGLPGDTKEAHFKSIRDVVDAEIDVAILFQFMLLPGTALAGREEREKYGFTAKYRVLSYCFGRYGWPESEDIITSEVEIICVASNSLSFDDYLACRRFDLTVAIFYNDALLSDLYRILKTLGISIFDFLVDLQETALKSDMKEIYEEFTRETESELYESPEAIMAHINEPGVLEKYRNGEYGANLIFKYKALAFSRYIGFMIKIAYNHAEKLIRQQKQSMLEKYPHVFEFLKELQTFQSSLLSDLLDTSKSFNLDLNFNIAEYHAQALPLNRVMKTKEKVKIEHTAEQKDIISKSIARHGEGIIGTSKLISQIPLAMLLRKTIVEKR
ncbi:MAG: radical SAM protein [Patescibacteria group bacterium]|jgi:radical SAM superfamily enzyme YgiQ (UPF0313 family)